MVDKLVSVIIPTYKRSDTLPRAIDSVLNQTYKQIEIIVVDDNDPESSFRHDTEVVMSRYKNNSNVLYIKHTKNKNGSAARNTGFRKSKGAYIMFLDDDDEFLPDKVLSQVEKMNDLDNSWGACYTRYIRKRNGKVVVRSAEKAEGNLLVEELMRNLFVHAGSNLLIRREVVEEIGGFDESFIRNQDVEFLTRILKKYKLAYVDTLGLIVYMRNVRNVAKLDFINLTDKYIEKFDKEINQLPIAEQNRVHTMINLQIFRYYLSSKKFGQAYKIVINNQISIFLVLKYLFYLLNRAVTKQAYGFKI